MSENPAAASAAPDPAPAETEAETLLPASPSSSRMRVVLVAAAVTFGVLLLDQLTKVWALHSLEVGQPSRPVIGNFITFRLVFNPGAALGLGTDHTWVLSLLVLAVVGVLIAVIVRTRSLLWAVTLGALLGGALGNLGDRIFRAPGFLRGHVVDFIGYSNWFTGNVADIFIVAASVALALLALFGLGLDGRRHHGAAAASKAPSVESPVDAVDEADEEGSP